MTTSKLLLGSLAAASSAFILGMLSTSSCQFVSISFSLTFTPSEAVNDKSSPSNFVTIFLGLWRHQSFGITNGSFLVANTCEEYSSQITVDGNWMVARALSILALVFGGMHTLTMSWLSFGRKKSCSSTSMCTKISPWIHLLCCIFQALTLIVLRSEFCNQSLKQSVESLLERATIEWGTYKLESGSKMTMASVVCWFLAFGLALVNVIGSYCNCNIGEKDECLTNAQPNQNSIATVSKDDGLDEEATAAEAEISPTVVPKTTTNSVASKAATVSPREKSTTAVPSSPKNSPSKQKTSKNADNEIRLSSRVTSATAGRRRAKYR